MPLPSSLLAGLDPARFLTEYWQRKPLLIRDAFPGFESPISPDELAGLACEPEVESRIVLEKHGAAPWQVEHGPFAESRFASLPETHMSLLVQGCDHHVPALAALREQFDFLPNWRLDDIMVSYAEPAGSVGPHVDQYDVFLLQASGKRRWQISYAPVDPDNFIEDIELRVLRQFSADEDWILEPGDMLYLPPGIAHYGVAVDACMTISVGFRAPACAEIYSAYTDALLDRFDETQRYVDPDPGLQQHPGEITADALQRVSDILRRHAATPDVVAECFGRLVTEPGAHRSALANLEDDIAAGDADAFIAHLQHAPRLQRAPAARLAFFHRDDGSCLLFVDGAMLTLPPDLAPAAPMLCDRQVVSAGDLEPWLAREGFVELLGALYLRGVLELNDA